MKTVLTLEQAKEIYDIIMASAGGGGYSAYNSVAEMKSDTDLKAGDYAITTGYYEYKDGGGGEYIITDSSSYEDGGLIIALSNGLKAELIVRNNTVNAKQFGCKMDGSTDDTERANAFLNIISNSDSKKMWRLYFPKGVMVTSGTLNIWWAYNGYYHSEVIFDNTLIYYTGTTCALHVNEANRLTVRGLTIGANTEDVYVRITSAQNVTFEECRMKELRIGGFEDSMEESKVVCYLTFNNCEFSHVVMDAISEDYYCNCIYFNESHIFSGDLTAQNFDYCFEFRRYANTITFLNCDISYAAKALFLMDEENNGGGIISLNGCYLDSGVPLTDANPDSLAYQINIFNCFSGDNFLLYNHVMTPINYSRTLSIGNLSHGTNLISTYAKNILVNGDFWNTRMETISYHDYTYNLLYGTDTVRSDVTEFPSSMELVDCSNAPNGKALRCEFRTVEELEALGDGHSQQLAFINRTVPLKGQYSAGIRVIKRSETKTGTLELSVTGVSGEKYRHFEFANMEVGEEYICCMDIGRDPTDYTKPDFTNFEVGVSARDVTDVAPIFDIVEVGCNYGMTWIPGLKSESPLMDSCTTDERPVPARTGFTTFDSTVGKPIWWNGTSWVDSNGETV